MLEQVEKKQSAISGDIATLAIVSFAGALIGALPPTTKRKLAVGLMDAFLGVEPERVESASARTLRIEQRAAEIYAARIACGQGGTFDNDAFGEVFDLELWSLEEEIEARELYVEMVRTGGYE